MNWTLAIIQALVIAGISALISYIISSRQKKLDFSYDYRKYILEKRKAAYAQIEQLIPFYKARNLDLITNHEFDPETAKAIADATQNIRENFGFWISPSINDKLFELMTTFAKARVIKFQQNGAVSEDIFKMYSFISTVIMEVEECYFKDIICLDDVAAFKKTKMAHHKSAIGRVKDDPILS
jgi:hypothetical protein